MHESRLNRIIFFFASFVNSRKKVYTFIRINFAIVAEDGREQRWGGDALGISGGMSSWSGHLYEYGGPGHGLLTLGTTTIHAMDLKTFCRFGNIIYKSLNVVPYLLDQRGKNFLWGVSLVWRSRATEIGPLQSTRARIFGIEESKISRGEKTRRRFSFPLPATRSKTRFVEKKKKRNGTRVFHESRNLSLTVVKRARLL